MKTWIILPYDDSPAARATLRHAAQEVRTKRGASRHLGVMLATAGVDPEALDHLLDEACAIAGPDVLIELRLLGAGDPIGDFGHLTASFPEAVLAAPIGAVGNAPWYAEACRFNGQDHALMLFFIRPQELRASQPHRKQHAPHTFGATARAVARRGAGLLRSLDTAWHREPDPTDAGEMRSRAQPDSDEGRSQHGEANHTSDAGTTTNPAPTTWQASQ